jgi:hypothetical protein
MSYLVVTFRKEVQTWISLGIVILVWSSKGEYLMYLEAAKGGMSFDECDPTGNYQRLSIRGQLVGRSSSKLWRN